LGEASVSGKRAWKERAPSPETAGGTGARATLPIAQEHEVYEVKPVQLAYP